MRAFLAVDLPDDVRASLVALQRRVPVGRIMAEETLHLTLAFLGDVTDAQAGAVDECVSARHLPGASVEIRGAGTFGEPPRVLWAGVEPDEGLTHLRKAVRSAVRDAGIDLPRERFRPHVTLARFGGADGADGRIGAFCVAEARFAIPAFTVGGVTLFRSDLGAEGARHTPLAAYPVG